YRAIQEGLTNAMRHAHSKEVQLELGRTAAGDLEFIIKNRIHAPKPFQEGLGLKNMRKRLDEIKGTCSIYQTEKESIVRGHFPRTEHLTSVRKKSPASKRRDRGRLLSVRYGRKLSLLCVYWYK